jgi:outer membrane protein TolC
MKIRQIYKVVFMAAIVLYWIRFESGIALAAEKLDASLSRIEHRLQEESTMSPSEPNSLTYLRAIGEQPARTISPREMKDAKVLTLEQCLQSAFTSSNEIKQAREQILAVGGSKLINNSRFMPSIELISQYEHFRNFDSDNRTDDATSISAKISQRIFEYGKDNPLDVSLRREQRDALFNYENVIASVFSQVRKAFFFIKLKEQQIAKRQELLEQFEKQHEIKSQRMEENNLSTKMEVLTAYLNVLTERSAINALEREKFNRKVDLLRLIGLPVGADKVEFEGQMDNFALDENKFDMDGMILLSLAQSSQVALAEAYVAEQQRVLDQLRYEYMPDLRASAGYQDEDGKIGADLFNDDDTWGLDIFGQPEMPGQKASRSQSLGIFGDDVSLGGPDPGWFAGLQLRIPITEGGARKGRQIQTRAILNSFKAALEDQKDRIESNVRKQYNLLTEQKFQVDLQQQNVDIESQRFMIQTQLRDVGRIDDDALERFRENFFREQDNLFSEQGNLIERQEDLRYAIRFFK